MLRALQRLLETIYDAPSMHAVEDFLITQPALRYGSPSVDEQVLVTEDDGHGASIGVFLDPQVLARLALANPLDALCDGNLADFCTVMEGVSHFHYLAWNAGHDRGVSRLELELQAEVDKYLSGRWLLCRQRASRYARDLHWLLFERARVEPALAGADYALYQTAHRYAARYCRDLDRRLASDRRGQRRTAITELRRFYRCGPIRKLRHIDGLA
jgi:hypothetical protein